jgi:hypothetical protein
MYPHIFNVALVLRGRMAKYLASCFSAQLSSLQSVAPDSWSSSEACAAEPNRRRSRSLLRRVRNCDCRLSTRALGHRPAVISGIPFQHASINHLEVMTKLCNVQLNAGWHPLYKNETAVHGTIQCEPLNCEKSVRRIYSIILLN